MTAWASVTTSKMSSYKAIQGTWYFNLLQFHSDQILAFLYKGNTLSTDKQLAVGSFYLPHPSLLSQMENPIHMNTYRNDDHSNFKNACSTNVTLSLYSKNRLKITFGMTVKH